MMVISLIGLIGLIGIKREAWAASSSKLGLFVIYFSDGGEKVTMACPKIMTFYDPQNSQTRQDLLHDYKTKCPNGIAVVRIHDGVAEKQVDFQEKPENSADEFSEIILKKVSELGTDASLVDYVSGTNEFENYDN